MVESSPHRAALHINQRSIHGEADTTSDIGSPLSPCAAAPSSFGTEAFDGAGRCSLDVSPGEVAFNANHKPRVHLPVVANGAAGQPAIDLGLIECIAAQRVTDAASANAA